MKTVLSFLATALLGALAFAQPAVDPELLPLMNSSIEDTTPVTVILQINDKLELPRLPHNASAHAEMEVSLMKNAALSQSGIMKRLLAAGSRGEVLRLKRYWLINAIIAEMPANQVHKLMDDPDVKAIRANRRIHLIEPLAGRLAVPEGDDFTYGLKKANIPQLRQKFPNITGKDVRVGILDTGIDASHPDLKGRLLVWKDFASTSTTPVDGHGHGTHVAGTISGGNASGTFIGMAPGVKLVDGRIFDANGSTTEEIIFDGMQWMADPDGNPATHDAPALVSNSWGGGYSSANADPMDDPLCKAVATWAQLGILPVFAAGNSGSRPGSVNVPGACPYAFAVGATDDKDGIAKFSSRGPATWKTGKIIKPNVSAPGVDVYSSLPSGKYAKWSGTSMATPHVSGLAALVYQAVPNITVEGAGKLMMGAATDLGASGMDNDFGAGRIDALKTVGKLEELMRSHAGQ